MHTTLIADSAQEHSHDQRQNFSWPYMDTFVHAAPSPEVIQDSIIEQTFHTSIASMQDPILAQEEHLDDNSQQSNESSPEQVPLSAELGYDCADTGSEPPVIELEIQQLGLSVGDVSGLDQVLPQPRKFIFKRNSQLLLGRAPSCGSDAKAKMRQSVGTSHMHRQAQALNGSDDGLFTNQVVSKVHAALYEADGHLILEDKQSTHGTYVNEERIQSRVLKDLDRVKLGRDVVRKDIPYVPLEFTVRIKNRQEMTNDEHTFQDQAYSRDQDSHEDQDYLEDQDYSEDQDYLKDQDYPEGLNCNPCDGNPHSMEYSDLLSDSELPYEDETLDYSRGPQDRSFYQDNTMGNVTNDVLPISVAVSEIDASTVTVHESSKVTELTDDRAQVAATDLNKRKRSEYDQIVHESPERKRIALVAAALAGVVVGSIGTIVTLASI